VSRWQATRLVAGRELREALRRRTFWIIIGVLLAASIAAVVLPEVISGGRTTYAVVVVHGTPAIDEQLDAVAEALDVDLDVSRAASQQVATQLVADGDADVAVIVGERPVVLAKDGNADTLVATAQQVVETQALADRLVGDGLTRGEVQAALQDSSARVVRLAEDESSRRGSAFIVSIVLYLLLLMLMIQVANGTAIEKANRISEVLLAIVRPGALLFGKVLGVGIIGVLTLLCGLLPPIVKLAMGGDLPVGLGTAILGGAPWFILGVVLYLTTAGALGALVERQEEAGSVVSPLTFLLIGSYFVSQSASDTVVGQVLAVLPYTSTLAMPTRIAVGAATAPEIVLSLLLNVIAVVIAVRLGSRIYGRAIVRTGRRLKVREVLQAP
jgi:ABC-2 type transport system permease protein